MTKLEFMDYKKLWECVINRKPTDEKRIPGAFTGWDNKIKMNCFQKGRLKWHRL